MTNTRCVRCGLQQSEWKGRWEDPLCETLHGYKKTTYDQHTLEHTPVESWEERFDEKFLHTGDTIATIAGYSDDIKQFLRETLAQQREEIVGRVEEMKTSKKYKAMVENGDLSFLNYTPTGIYVKGLEDAIKIIKGE